MSKQTQWISVVVVLLAAMIIGSQYVRAHEPHVPRTATMSTPADTPGLRL